jgi:DNA-binding MarR family transcriptional regulator
VSETAAPDALTTKCAALMRALMGTHARSDSSAWLDLEITMGQLKALMTLIVNGAQSVGELGRALGIAEPSASMLVDKLEEHGFATRATDSEDRRRTLVQPTTAAQDLFDHLQRGRNEQLAEWLGELGEDDLRALTQGLGALVRVTGAQPCDAQQRAAVQP